MLNLLLVEDDIDLATSVVDYLELEQISCDHAANGVIGLALIEANEFDAIILDLNLPRMDGLTLCRRLRDRGDDTPVLMLTARDSLDDKLTGFDAGTDDYLVKPFAMEELVVRVQALAKRRSGQTKLLTTLGVELDLAAKTARRNGRIVKLSPTGFRLLELLMRHSPDPVSREVLMQGIWGQDQPDSNSLKVHIYKLRKQLEVEGPLLHTISGFGFALRSSDED